MTERELKPVVLENGQCPFDAWFESLRDKKMQQAVDSRLTRMRAGNFGDHEPVGSGVFELRLDIGPGLRIYYGEQDKKIVILLGGGDKRSQSRDINRAIQLWEQLKEIRKHASKKLQK